VNDARRQPASFRDRSGFLFIRDGKLYRQVNRGYQPDYDLLLSSGMYQELVERGLLVPHTEVGEAPAEPGLAYKVLEPERIPFISYPYEWCFGQLKRAALATLEIQKRALPRGLSLKDASAYNIQFRGSRPVLIDTLSFERFVEDRPWVAYRQFCQHFLAPLALMAFVDVRLSQLLRVHIDGIPLDLASRLLPARTRLNPALALHLHLHAGAQRRYADATASPSRGRMTRVGHIGLIENLEAAVRGLRWEPRGTAWQSYYEETNYSAGGLEHKLALTESFLKQAQPRSVWDLGANTGMFSRIASRQGAYTLSIDSDPGAVELNDRACVQEDERALLPLLIDLTNPSPALGWQNEERMSLRERGPADALLALALVHHLAIANNTPLPDIAAWFSRLTRWLILEFVPKDDSQVQRLLSFRADIFDDYHEAGLEKAFAGQFRIVSRQPIRESARLLYLMERR
jgi:ribosomal protein L11 methylase PrmA